MTVASGSRSNSSSQRRKRARTPVKFQLHDADAETTPEAPPPPTSPPRHATSTSGELRSPTSSGCGSSAVARMPAWSFSAPPSRPEALARLEELGTKRHKIASGEVSNVPLLEQVAATGKPVILSSGMSSWEELDRAVEIFVRGGNDLALLQCTSEYPCPPEHVGLNVMVEMKGRYDVPVGISDHTEGLAASLAAVASRRARSSSATSLSRAGCTAPTQRFSLEPEDSRPARPRDPRARADAGLTRGQGRARRPRRHEGDLREERRCAGRHRRGHGASTRRC